MNHALRHVNFAKVHRLIKRQYGSAYQSGRFNLNDQGGQPAQCCCLITCLLAEEDTANIYCMYLLLRCSQYNIACMRHCDAAMLREDATTVHLLVASPDERRLLLC